jgi:hypothetical protein
MRKNPIWAQSQKMTLMCRAVELMGSRKTLIASRWRGSGSQNRWNDERGMEIIYQKWHGITGLMSEGIR